MLKVLRDNLKYLSWVLWLVIAVFILFVFVDFGGSVPGGSAPSDAAVTIGGHQVSYGDFERAYRQTEDTYRQLYGDQFNSDTAKQLGLPLQVLNGLVADKILLIEGKRMGLTITDDELRREILAFPAFQAADGSFVGAEEYDRILRRGGLNTDSFEQLMRTDLMTQKVRSVLAQNVFVSDAEAESTYRRRTEQARIRFLRLPWSSIDEVVTLDEAEIEAHFEANREAFRIPERRIVDYVLINRRDVQESLSVEADRVRRYYDENPTEFSREEQVRARHILVQVNDQRSESEARARLDEARRQLQDGADFATLAAELSDD
ncbi:MAG: SurA N-terminal domain-containing protein, partial [Acidobacteriota bacterium]|nr:SurA N-terminal domain-containing protein [Acidobacteriota bacterium]